MLANVANIILKNYFKNLVDNGLYDHSNNGDRIALLTIHMPLLQRALHSFVRKWNVSTIQAQRHRPNAVTGQP